MTSKPWRKRAQPYEFLTNSIAQIEERPLSSHGERVRAIGRRAFRIGGIGFMREVFWRLDKRGVHVGGCWDGIGGWHR